MTPRAPRPPSVAPGGIPAWKALLAAPIAAADASVLRHSGRVGSQPVAAHDRPATRMGLQFELREQTPRTSDRWRGPTAQPVKKLTPGHGDFRLGVRPVVHNDNGNWVRASLAWNNLTFQVRELNLDPTQHRWFSELIALYRAVRLVYSSQEADWIYLDEFSSPLLWHFFEQATVLGIAFVGTQKNVSVSVADTASVSLDVTQAQGALNLAAVLTLDDRPYPAEQAGAIGTHGVYTYAFTPHATFTLAPTSQTLTTAQRALMGKASAAVVPESDVTEFLTEYYPALRRTLPTTSTDASVIFDAPPPPVLVVTARFEAQQTLRLDGEFEYREGTLVTHLALEPRADDTDPRDGDAEAELRGRVADVLNPSDARTDDEGPPPAALGDTLRGIDAARFTATVLNQLRALPGVRVDVVGDEPNYRELTATPELTFTTVESTQRDWFDLGVLVRVDGRSVPFAPLFTALSKGQARLLLVDNSYLSLRQPVFDRLRELIEEARELSEWETGLRISRHQASLWADFEDLADETEQAVSWRAAVGGLLNVTAIEPTPLPPGVTATLRPYQLQGFQWLAFLYTHRLGGILADDMGLGKTLQALALMEHATRVAAVGTVSTVGTVGTAEHRRPFVVVAPTSVVSNWVTEAARFTPGLRVRAITATEGASRTSIADAAADADVIVTSYALFRLDFDAYQAHGWAGLVLDEAQFVKNRTSQAYLCARDLRTPFKLAITGTPMENTLLDLWSLLSIVAPGLFASARLFTETYVRPLELQTNAALFAQLRRRIRPVLLRRTKEVVAPELPPKQEQVLAIELNPEHRVIYDTFLQRERQKLLGLIDDMDKNRFIIFRSITLLRLLSLDATLVDEAYRDVSSSKLDVLLEQLEDVVAEGHRALIFSQFTSFLRLAAARLDALGTPYCYLDGSTLARSEVIDRFKTGLAPVFLISLKAGGFGLNLTEADYVFLLDPWWNPASEAQAIDRTHRIGQTRNVMVYRMVATGTIEEKVMALKQRKAALFDAVLGDDADFSESLTADDIRSLFELPAGTRDVT
ncbi:DEAD/DEAH box helicase [Cryobacterium sp. CG_9.6]|uniref:DEAD/DEAH box helicase n=1 Tax=Cryobacterium sp. CG_9.6 TaxID=2760710 RepID=UPI00247397FF|nr:DEAD/DEAH box helicase [Cryobacterium sp. CG_9.6]MDH6237687.1 superfamily II DNA or RNA helicase [Cryobacterium sp. CG_9.6]